MMMMEDLPPADANPPEASALEDEGLVPVLVESKWRVIGFGVLVFLLVIWVAAGVVFLMAYLVGRFGSKKDDHGGLAPASGPGEYRAADGPLFSPLSSLAVAEPSRSRDLAPCATICNKTIEGIADVGSFPGSERITGRQVKHVDTMRSIALTFVNHHLRSSPTVDRFHNRRLLHVRAGSGSSFSAMR